MLYCPNCGAEYREGYSSCSDCHVLLVRERPRQKAFTPDSRVVWRGNRQQDGVFLGYELQDLGIVYEVRDTPASLALRMDINRRYEIAVASSDYERAKSGLAFEADPPGTISEAEWQKMGEETDASEEEPYVFRETLGMESLPDTPARRDAYFRDWYPEDATVQIWSGGGNEDISGGLEMALKENLIHCRVDGEGDDKKIIFVMPEDEARAREIVREMIEGTPME